MVGGIVKLFEFEAITEHNEPEAGVSTKPKDGTLVHLRLRLAVNPIFTRVG